MTFLSKYVDPDQEEPVIVPQLELDDEEPHTSSRWESEVDNNIPKAQWLGLLVPNLGSGKARDAYTDIHASDHLTYDMLKRCMLKRYELTPEAYRRKFRGHSCSDNQSLKEANFKLAYLFDKWVETSNIPKTYNGLRGNDAHGPGESLNSIRAKPVCAGKRAILIERDGHCD